MDSLTVAGQEELLAVVALVEAGEVGPMKVAAEGLPIPGECMDWVGTESVAGRTPLGSYRYCPFHPGC